jgi:hypothetical protein
MMKEKAMKRRSRLSFGWLGFAWICTSALHAGEKQEWKPVADWGHWRLGQKADTSFLVNNHMTVTFGSGAPNFESVTRQEFDAKIGEAREFNAKYHDRGYIVLRYLSTSLNGETATAADEPRKDQIGLLKFYNEQWDSFADIIGPRPPEDPTTWMMVRPDGTFPYYRYAPYGRKTTGGFEAWGCPDNPAYVRMMEGKIRAQAGTGIDGSYVDWTHISGGTCYCPYTRANFIQYLKGFLGSETAKRKYGVTDFESITLPRKRGDAFWMEWIRFRCSAVAEFHARLRAAAREVNPHFMISGNVFGGFGYGPIAYDAAGNMELLGQTDDFIYSEIQEFLDSAPRRDDGGMKITNSPALKFLAAASHGKPVIVYATEITPPVFPDPTEKCLSAMAQINIAEAFANHAVFREKRETPAGATAFYSFVAPHEPLLLGMQMTGNAAILASLNQYLADEISFAFSASRVLADRGIAHVMLTEDDLLSEDLKKVGVILVPHLPVLDIGKQEALLNFVRSGGHLIVLGESGVKDSFNLPIAGNRFLEMLGTKTYPDRDQEKRWGSGKIAFIPVRIPADRFLIPAKAKSTFTTFGPSMADVFPDIPEGYTRGRIDPRLREILEKAADKVLRLLDGRVTRLAEPSRFVEISTMTNPEKERLLVHLVNYDVTVDGAITAAKNIAVQALLPGGRKASRITCSGTLSEMKPLAFRTEVRKGGTLVHFTVDEIRIYGLAIIELE